MTSLLHSPASVHSKIRIFEPLPFADDAEPFLPSLEDEAYDLGYRLARDGENPLCPYKATNLNMRFVFGRIAGTKAREISEARELGRTLAFVLDQVIAPSGLAPHEVTAFDAGVAIGLAELHEDTEFEAWVASVEDERAALALADPVTDFDTYRSGCVS